MRIHYRLFFIINFLILALPVLAANTNVSSPSSPVPAPQSSPNAQMLSNQLAATITAAEDYQNQLKIQLQQLKEQNTDLKQQLMSVQEKLATVSAEVASRQMAIPQTVSEQPGLFQWIFSFFNLNNSMIDMHLAVGLMVLGLLLLAWLLWYRRPKLIDEAEQEVGDDEYDFMGSDEAIPAKLDLARAYIEMEKKDEAKKVLEEVTTKGSRAQKQEARKIKEQLEIKN